MKKILDEIAKDGKVILFVDEMHTLIGAGGAEGAIDASNILKPSLARGDIQMIGATTFDEYQKYIEKIKLWLVVSNKFVLTNLKKRSIGYFTSLKPKYESSTT